MKIHLETERLILREFTEDDAASLYELDSDSDVMRYVGSLSSRLADPQAYRERIRTGYFPYYEKYQGYGYWAVIEKSSREFIGWFHLRPALDYRFAAAAGFRPGDIDLGYRFRKSSWGKGYATEGARSLVHKAFDEQGAACVVAVALAGNSASIRVLEKTGLRFVNEFDLPGYGPAVKYALAHVTRDTIE
jgi:ribosomal-protein-alanine N-acetyltransferase